MSEPLEVGSGPRTRRVLRTFVAVEVPNDIKAALVRTVEPLARRFRLRWTRPEGWHLTLKFLGERTQDEVDRIIAVTEAVAAQIKPYEAALGGWGAFPTEKRPRVLWLGTAAGSGELAHGAAALDAKLAEAGFPAEKKQFHPHLTIARVEDSQAGADAMNELQAHPFVSRPFPVDRIVVFRSILDRGGARYHPLAVCQAGGGPHAHVE
jgi:2'-5' RNA ligase